MLPRRCKKCRCYVAPQLTRCPRCKTVAPSLIVNPAKEDKQDARSRRDAKVLTVHAKHMHWIPSAFAIRAQTAMAEELKRRLAREKSVRMRNSIRSELRMVNATLARTNVPDGKKPWTTETMHTKQACVVIFISPKKHRYVLADKDAPADLIIINRKRRFSIPVTRLQRFEKSRYARMKKTEQREAAVHKKRSIVKKKVRAERRKQKQS